MNLSHYFHAGHFAAQMLSPRQGWHQSVPANNSQSSLTQLWHVWVHVYFHVLSVLWFPGSWWQFVPSPKVSSGCPCRCKKESHVWRYLFILSIMFHFETFSASDHWRQWASWICDGLVLCLAWKTLDTKPYNAQEVGDMQDAVKRLFTSNCRCLRGILSASFFVPIQQHTTLWNEDPGIAASYQGAFKEKVAEATNNSNSWTAVCHLWCPEKKCAVVMHCCSWNPMQIRDLLYNVSEYFFLFVIVCSKYYAVSKY